MRTDQMIARLPDLLEKVRTHFNVPGIAVAIDDGRTSRGAASGLCSTSDGNLMTVNHRVPISCVMKVLVSWITLYAEGEGLIDLEEDIANYLPHSVSSAGKTGIRVRHLLTHTAGYVEPRENSARWGYDLPRFMSFFPDRVQAFTPGSVWSYTHTGHALLASILESQFNKSMDDILRTRLLDPLGMTLPYLSADRAIASHAAALHIKDPRSGRYLPMRPPQETGFLRFSISDGLLSTRHLARIATALAGGYRKKLTHLEPARIRLLSSAVRIPHYFSGSNGELMPRAFCHGVADYGDTKGINGSYVGATCALRFQEGHPGLAVTVNAYEPHVRDVVTKAVVSAFYRSYSCSTPSAPLRAADWLDAEGLYQGLMLGSGDATVIRNNDNLRCTVKFKRGEEIVSDFTLDSSGQWNLDHRSPTLSLAFGRAEECGTPYLMVTTSAFSK